MRKSFLRMSGQNSLSTMTPAVSTVVDHVSISITAWLLAVLMIVCPIPATGQQGGKVLVRVHTPSGVSIPGARIRVEHGIDLIAESVTDSNGTVEFNGLQADRYRIFAASPAHQSSSGTVDLSGDQRALEIDFTLVGKLERTESIEVRATAEPEIEQSSSPAIGLRREDVKSLPGRPATVADTLPLVPGITRTPDGEIQIGGTGEHRSALVVNATDVTDPATGRFGSTVPVDSVESIDVFKTPFLAQYGRFTSGVISVETRRGGEKWHFELNDPFPDFRIRSWRLRGLRDASPRINFSGPLIANKLYISEGLEYSIAKTPVRTLPFPNNDSKTESVNSFSQLDYIVSANQLVTGTVHLTPRHTNFVDPQFFSPQPTTPNFRGFDRAWTLIDHKAAHGWLIDSTLGYQAFDALVGSQ